ncbi:MAG: hypothetical protein O2901_09520, partial [Verrucomicrobia bacterium]|nr:hypothetical protein [Verrucomicrobiota bacterium]
LVALSTSHAWAQARQYSLKTVSERITGFVYYTDGETPAEDVLVRVWNVKTGDVIHETRTDEIGFYELPKLELGDYMVTFDRIRLDLEIVGREAAVVQHPHNIVVVIPRAFPWTSPVALTSYLLPTAVIIGEPLIRAGEEDQKIFVIPRPPDEPPERPPEVVSP